jgi:hypothetical protein
VLVWRDRQRYVAQLLIDDGSPSAVTRSVSGEDCSEVARAIALVTALAIDAALFGLDPSAATPESIAAPARPEVAPRAAAPAPMAAGPTASPRWRLGVRATVTTPKAPKPLFGAALTGAIGARSRDWLLELGLGAERGGRVANEVGEARFTYVGGSAGVCATLWHPFDALRVMPCALFELGVVHAEGFIEKPASALDPWAALEPAIRLTLGTGAWDLELQGGALFPLRVRDRFVFGEPDEPDSVIHDVPAIGAAAALGFAVGLD